MTTERRVGFPLADSDTDRSPLDTRISQAFTDSGQKRDEDIFFGTTSYISMKSIESIDNNLHRVVVSRMKVTMTYARLHYDKM